MDCPVCNKDVMCRPCLQKSIDRVTDLIKYWTKQAENARDLLQIPPPHEDGIFYSGKAVGFTNALGIMERVFEC